MKDLKITNGEWMVDFDRVPNSMGVLAEHIAITASDWDVACVFNDITDDGDEEKANAVLIADAGNTAQKCGLLPSELLRQRDELLFSLSDMIRYHGENAGDMPITTLEIIRTMIEDAIKSTEQ